MKLAILAALISLTTLNAQAADSTWFLCNNGSLAINSLEHRSGADSRQTEVTMIVGMNFMSGKLVNKDSGAISLAGKPGDKNDFNGSIAFDYANKIVSVRGTMRLSGQPFAISTRMPCKELNANAN